MCGITGFIHASYPQEKWRNTLVSMAGKLVHRGPDAEGVWFDIREGVGLAHRRLSIIDLSVEGNQPMVSQSGRYVIVYNGEVYNFKKIRKTLKKQNFQWRGHSDTEVILAAIETWGLEPAIKRFIGMFAFALWDRKERILYLCRDRIGIKPLYYGYIQKGIVFGSELKSLRVHPDFKSTINRDSLALYLRHNYIPAPYCIFQNTWKLMPGHILRISAKTFEHGKEPDGSYPYWSAKNIAESGQKEPLQISVGCALDQFEDLLRDAIKMRMISDVPLGAFLSGGIDSSTVVALMQTVSQRPVNTYCIGFKDEGYNETKHAQAVADHLGTQHTQLYVTPEDALNSIPELPELYDEPFSDASQIPTFLLSKLTRNHVTVSLSGDGGDELFGGYIRYDLGPGVWRKIRSLPPFFRTFMSRILIGIPPHILDTLIKYMTVFYPRLSNIPSPGDKIHKFAEWLDVKSFESLYRCIVSYWKEPDKIVFNASEPSTLLTKYPDHPELKDLIHKMMFLDLVTYLPDDILTKIDRASMGVSLEVRVPLLDHRVVEYAWRLPLSLKIRNNQSKWILRQVLYKYMPKELIERPKKGFEIPIRDWLRGPLRDWAENIMNEKKLKEDGFFDHVPIRKKWREHLSGKHNWQHYLWSILMFQAWREKQ